MHRKTFLGEDPQAGSKPDLHREHDSTTQLERPSGERGIRTPEGVSQQIYSLSHLAALESPRVKKRLTPTTTSKSELLPPDSHTAVGAAYLRPLSPLADSNRGPPDYKSGALPTELRRRKKRNAKLDNAWITCKPITPYFLLVHRPANLPQRARLK